MICRLPSAGKKNVRIFSQSLAHDKLIIRTQNASHPLVVVLVYIIMQSNFEGMRGSRKFSALK